MCSRVTRWSSDVTNCDLSPPRPTAVETACKVGDEDDGAAIIVALRKLQTEIEELASQVLPLLTKEQQNVTHPPFKQSLPRVR
jgi:hypothetical protein